MLVFEQKARRAYRPKKQQHQKRYRSRKECKNKINNRSNYDEL